MKITRDTPDQLIIENRPWLIGGFLIVFTLIFVAVGLAAITYGEGVMGYAFVFFGGGAGMLAFAVFVRRVQVIFDRAAGSIRFRRKSVFGSSDVTHDLKHLDRAVVESSYSGDSGATHRCVIILSGGMSAGVHPLTMAYSSGPGAQRAADAINAWCANGL